MLDQGRQTMLSELWKVRCTVSSAAMAWAFSVIGSVDRFGLVIVARHVAVPKQDAHSVGTHLSKVPFGHGLCGGVLSHPGAAMHLIQPCNCITALSCAVQL